MSMVTIHMTAKGVFSKVQVDGRDVAGVVGVSFQGGLGRANSVVLTIDADALEIKADQADVCENVQ